MHTRLVAGAVLLVITAGIGGCLRPALRSVMQRTFDSSCLLLVYDGRYVLGCAGCESGVSDFDGTPSVTGPLVGEAGWWERWAKPVSAFQMELASKAGSRPRLIVEVPLGDVDIVTSSQLEHIATEMGHWYVRGESSLTGPDDLASLVDDHAVAGQD